jgi:hypothetical protein
MESLTVTVAAERHPSVLDGTLRRFTDFEQDQIVEAISTALGGIQVDYWRIGVERTGGRFHFASDAVPNWSDTPLEFPPAGIPDQ